MKNRFSLLLALALLLNFVGLTACAHACTYASVWSSDDTDHWRACTDPACALVTDKGPHEWDEGVITSPATQEADGEKTFTCATCAKTKTEPVAFTGISRYEWIQALSSESFQNFTYTMTVATSAQGVSVETRDVYYITPIKICHFTYTEGEETSENIVGGQVALTKSELIGNLRYKFEYYNFSYDTEEKCYRSNEPVHMDGVDATDILFRFENGKLAGYSYTMLFQNVGFVVRSDVTIEITDYGTTVLPQ